MSAERWLAEGRPALEPALAGGLAAGVRGLWSREVCREAVARIVARCAAWTADFGGEQFALGQAFYTHLETGRAREYFAGARRADALVEATLPGMQAEVREIFGRLVGGAARPRTGFCGPGVHVFPAGEKVAREGGVLHFDTEGISPLHLGRGARARTLVVMLQAPTRGGGLRLWDVHYAGRDEPSEDEAGSPSVLAAYRVGDALLVDSRRLHQIQRFSGGRDRISVTVHGVEVDRDVWDTWF